MSEVKEAQRAAILPTIFMTLGFLLVLLNEGLFQIFGLLFFLLAVVYMFVYGCRNWNKR